MGDIGFKYLLCLSKHKRNLVSVKKKIQLDQAKEIFLSCGPAQRSTSVLGMKMRQGHRREEVGDKGEGSRDAVQSPAVVKFKQYI